MTTAIATSFRMPVKDGRILSFEQITPDSRELLQRGLEEMSPESRYLRFMHPVSRLSDKELDYFTRIDQYNHVAWGAIEQLPSGPHGLGVGRYVRSVEKSDTAEFALTVIDKYQGLGIGSVLLAILYTVGQQHGLSFLSGYVLGTNVYAAEKMHQIGAKVRSEQGQFLVDIPIIDVTKLPNNPFAHRFRETVEAIRSQVILL